MTADGTERKLAAIMFTDMVGYSALAQRNASEAAERRIQVRIGLHLGDVEVRDGDVFGDGVNIAARVEPLADADGICITGPVFDQVHNKIDEALVRLERPELDHVLRGRCCPGGCAARLVVTFESASGEPGDPLCSVCFTPWRVPVLVRDGETYEPVVRRDTNPTP